MGARLAIIVGNQFEKNEMIDLKLLHNHLITSVIENRVSEDVGDIHPVLREKVETFDFDRLEQLGYQIRKGIQMKDDVEDGFTIHCGFSTLYWNIIQTLSCIKTYSSK